MILLVHQSSPDPFIAHLEAWVLHVCHVNKTKQLDLQGEQN
jgi:hypothetical protein